MVSSSIIYTLLFTMGLLLIDSMYASSVHNQGDRADTILSLKKRSADLHDENQGVMFGKHRFASRAVRLPSESILLGKRRLPIEAVLLGRRNMPNEDVLFEKRR